MTTMSEVWRPARAKEAASPGVPMDPCCCGVAAGLDPGPGAQENRAWSSGSVEEARSSACRGAYGVWVAVKSGELDMEVRHARSSIPCVVQAPEPASATVPCRFTCPHLPAHLHPARTSKSPICPGRPPRCLLTQPSLPSSASHPAQAPCLRRGLPYPPPCSNEAPRLHSRLPHSPLCSPETCSLFLPIRLSVRYDTGPA